MLVRTLQQWIEDQMATDGDKTAAAILAASLLQPFEGSGDVGGREKAQAGAVERAVSLYRAILDSMQTP